MRDRRSVQSSTEALRRGHSRALCASQVSPAGRLGEEIAQHSTSTAPMALRSPGALTTPPGGLPPQALLSPPREILPFARDGARRRTLREGGRQRERWLLQGLLGRPVSESGRLRHGDGDPEGGNRCRRGLVLTILSAAAGARPGRRRLRVDGDRPLADRWH